VIHQKQMTAEEFITFAEQHPDKRFDFIDGEIVEVSPKPLHGMMQVRLAVALDAYNQQQPLGVVYTEVLHVLNGEKFIPDVAINQATTADYLTEPPLIAVEIRSDSQSRESQRRKAQAYIQHGTPLVVLVFPGEGFEVFRPGQATLVLSLDDMFDGGAELPGFMLPVRDILG
jgi:Uma2 family endonuclease